MRSDWRALSDEELGRLLGESARAVAYPEMPDLAGLVARRIREEAAVPRAAGRGWAALRDLFRPVARPVLRPAWAKAAVTVAVIVALLSATLALSPSARRAVAGWLGLRGVKIEITPTPAPRPTASPTLGTGLQLGDRVTLAEAQMRVPFRILIPAELGSPDEVYVRTGFVADQVILLYRARPGLPKAYFTGAGLLLTEFQARIDRQFIEKKLIYEGSSLETVKVNGDPGYWISGNPHVVAYLDRNGNQIQDQTRLAGNVLLWQHGDVTFRIEADTTKGRALRIAASAR
ncbi:MAG: hypothetical protein E6G44_00970 [Actinobacteria bacterium]|nr:MAG: hypothetical protein E6G44_00970 [Actinomycetota bacterium]